MTLILQERIDKSNVLNEDYTWEGKQRDGIGLGMSRTKLMYFKLGEYHVKGAVCSGNQLPGAIESKYEKLSCFDRV